MKLTEEYFEKRILKDFYLSDVEYADCLFRGIQYLILDLNKYLEQENRRFGIVISYLNSIYQAYKRTDFTGIEENSNRVLYLLKPLILKEFRSLHKLQISNADCVIILLKKFLEIILSVENYKYNKEARTVYKIIEKLFNNIRNRSKNSDRKFFTDTIIKYLESGQIGKYFLESFSIIEELEQREKQKSLDGSGVRINEAHNKVTEVTWTDE